MKRKILSTLLALVLVLSFSLVMAVPVSAAVTVTVATGGSAISADTAATATSPAWTALTGPVIAEAAPADIGTGTIILVAPTGFAFNTGQSVAATVTGDATKLVLASGTATPTSTTITFTVSSASASNPSTITFSDIQVQPTAGTLPATGNILTTDSTSVIAGVTHGTTPFGTLTMVVGALHHFDVALSTASPVVGNTVTVPITAHDQFSNTVTSVTESLALNQTGADEPANLEWSGTDVIDNNNGTGRFIGSWASGVSTVYVTYTKASDAVTLAITGESSGKVGTSAAITWGPVAILTIVGTAYQNGNDTIVIGFNTEVQPADEGSWDADVFTSVKCGTTTLSLVGATFTPASGLTDTLTITLAEANAYLVSGATMYVTPASEAIKDASGNFAPITEKTGSAVSGDDVAPTFTIAYYTDSGLTTSLTNNYMKVGTYYIKITANEALSATPTISIDAEDTENDVTNAATTAVSSSTKVFKYTRTIVSATAPGSAVEEITITGTDLAGKTANNYAISSGEKYTDTVVPTIASIVGKTIAGAGDEIAITFTEASTPKIATPAATAWSKDAFTYIKCGTVTLVLPDEASAYVYSGLVLTITLAEDTENAYLVNDAALAVKAVASAIQDTAGNAVSVTEVTGTVNDGENDATAPTFTVAGVVETGDDTITITFSETVRAADGTWSANEFTIESPNAAPLNINHATFAPATGMADSLTITLNAATDGAFLVVGDAVKVYKVASAVLDLAGNDVSTTDASSSAIADPALPTITSIIGTTNSGAGDTIVITFSEAVTPEDETWSANEFTSIKCPVGAGGFTLTTATFAPTAGSTTTLTITLDEATDAAYLTNTEDIKVTPAAGEHEIFDADDNAVTTAEVTSTVAVDGDTMLPTIDSIIGYDDADIDANDNDVIRIDFSEAVRPAEAWNAETQLVISNADLDGATFEPANGITTTLTITLATAKELTAGQTLTVTPVVDKVLDLAGNKMAITAVASSAQPVNESYAIDLVSGWNLISLPLIPDSSAIATVLTGVTVDSVQTYDAATTTWSSYIPSGPVDLTTMVAGSGYWVEMSSAATIIVQGVELPVPPATPPTYDVVVGWNFIGFKSITAKVAGGAAGSYLEALGTNYTLIYRFDAASQSYVTVQSSGNFEPGKGYWIAITEAGTIYP